MKKLLSLLLVVSLAIICAFSTISATATTATPDEAKTPVSLEITYPPSYTRLDVFQNYLWGIGWDYVYDYENPDFEAIKNHMLNNEFMTTPTLLDVMLLVTYSDGSVEEINEYVCTSSLMDPPDLSKFNEESDIQDILKEVCRTYTAKIEYKGIYTTYEIEAYSSLKEDVQNKYEFVSYTEPDKTVYVIDVDTYIEYMEDANGNMRAFRIFEYDKTGMTATIRNKKTGELITYNEDNITILKVKQFVEAPCIPGSHSAMAFVTTEDGATVPFFVDVTHVVNSVEETTPSIEAETNPTINNTEVSTSDTATNDTVNNKPDNNAIQTGNPASAILLVVVMLSATAIAFVFYRKKA